MKTKIVWAIPAVLLSATNPGAGQRKEHSMDEAAKNTVDEGATQEDKPADPLWDDYNFLFSLSLS